MAKDRWSLSLSKHSLRCVSVSLWNWPIRAFLRGHWLINFVTWPINNTAPTMWRYPNDDFTTVVRIVGDVILSINSASVPCNSTTWLLTIWQMPNRRQRKIRPAGLPLDLSAKKPSTPIGQNQQRTMTQKPMERSRTYANCYPQLPWEQQAKVWQPRLPFQTTLFKKNIQLVL